MLSRAVVLKVWCLEHQRQSDLGICPKCRFSVPTPDLLNQKLGRQGLAIRVLTNPPGASD